MGVILFKLFCSWVLKTFHYANTSTKKRGHNKVRKALDQEGNFVFISKVMARTIEKRTDKQLKQNRLVVYEQAESAHSLKSGY